MTLDELRPTLLSLIPDVTAPGLTLDEIVNTIRRRLCAGKALDGYMGQILTRLKTLTGVDVTNVDDGLALAEAQQKTLAERLGTSYAREIELTRDLTEVKTRLQTAGKESADLARALHLAEDKINKQITNMAERSTLARFRDDMRAVLGEPNATAKYMVDTVDKMRRDLAAIKDSLGYPFATTPDVLTKIAAQIKDLDRVRDAIGLRESAPMDYVVQRICDTRRDLHWAQGTLSMVKQALGLDGEYDRHTIMSTIEGIIKAKKTIEDRHSAVLVGLCEDLDMPLHGAARVRDEIKARRKELAETKDALATLSNGLCDDLDMPTGDMDAVRKRVRDLVVFEQDVIRTMGGSDRDQVRDGIGVLQSEYKAQTDTFTILRQILGLGVGCALTTIVETVDRVLFEEKTLRTFRDDQAREIKNLRMNHAGPALAQDRLALIRFLDMAESTTWHEITNEVVRRISYTNGVLAGIGDSCQALGKIVGMDPTPALAVPALLALIERTTVIRDSLLAVVGHPGGETLSLNAALSLVQSKVSAVALSLGLSEYASLDAVKNKIALMPAPSGSHHQALADLNKILRRDLSLTDAMSTAVGEISALRAARDDQAWQIKTLRTSQDAQTDAQHKIRQRLLTLLCEDPNRAGTMTTDEVVNLLKSKFACLALNLALPEDATLNTIMERIQGMTPSALILRDLILTMGARGTMSANEAMREATERIKGMREGMHDLLQTWS